MNVYKDNIEICDTKLLRLSKLLSRISLIRLLIFFISIVVFIYLISSSLLTPLLIFFPFFLVSFGIAIVHHSKTDFLKKHTTFLKEINESEILRKECTLEGFETGTKFINQKHPYTSDLDIFGQHSIFQLINRTTTESGSILLSEWLSGPAQIDEIYARQEAIKELSLKLEWRQDFQAAGMHFQNKKSDYRKLLNWVEAPVVLFKHWHIYIASAIVLAVLSLLGIFFTMINLETSNVYFYSLCLCSVLIVNYLFLRKVKPIADNIVETSRENINTFKAYQALINKIESESFNSKKLLQLQSFFSKNDYSTCNEIQKLCRLLDFSEQRGVNKITRPIKGNPFYSLFNSFLLIDVHLVIGTEKWKSKNRTYVKSWADSVSEFEVINSFAGFSYSNPSYLFPEITEKSNYVHFDRLGHPLINAHSRVCNDFHSEGPGNVVMITGSNMGGKSTFLRTVGINLVLALAGSPCCSNYSQVSNLKLYTSMRTQDNLRDGVSSFYAELNRIEELLNQIKSNHNVFFLLDEMFRGTNSEDRHKGGFSLINQISKLRTSGIIATHDIELAKLCGDKKLVANYSFNSEIIEEEMIFSYRLHPEICNDFNASELMKRSGIEIVSDILNGENT